MSVTLQIRVNGGAPQTGGVTVVSGDVVQLTAATKAEWGTPVARWEMYDFPLGFAEPAGWSTDPSTGAYYYEGNTDPPTFTADANWGKFILKLAATDAGVRQTDSTSGVRVLSSTGYRNIGRGEGGQWGGTHGRWVRELQNDIKDLVGAATALATPTQTVHVADAELVFGQVNILTAVADGMTIPSVALNAGQSMEVINAMAATTAVLTRSGADVVVNGTSATAYNLPAGESVILRAAATGTNVYIEHGGSGGGGSGTEAPTGSTTLLRKSDGVGRVVGLQLETDTDASRTIKALRADTTTRDELTLDTTILKVKGGAGESTLYLSPDTDGDPFLAWATQSDGATPNGLSLSVADLSVNSTTCAIGATGACTVAGTSHKQTDASGNYSFERTNGSALTEVYQSTIASISKTHAQDTSAAGGSTTMRAQRGFAGFVGGDFIIGGGDGGTTGTNAPGNTRVKLGTPVGNVSGKLQLEREDGTVFMSLFQDAGPVSRITAGSGSLRFGNLTETEVYIAGSGVTTITANANVVQIGGTGIYLSSTPIRYPGYIHATFGTCGKVDSITSATTTTIASYTTATDRVYIAEGWLVVSNDTDNEGACYFLRAAFKNRGGVVTQIGTTVVTVIGEDAGQTGLDAVLDFSGTALRLRLVTDSGDTVTANGLIDVYERVAA